MRRILDLGGQRFGRLTAIGRDESCRRKYLCKCDCGKEKAISASHLAHGLTKSCGCLLTEVLVKRNSGMATHRMKGTPEYKTWLSMRRRCNDPGDKDYPRYGGRGIRVCQEWDKSFEKFFADMGKRPSKAHTLDRINVNGGYCLENCRWADLLEQANNRRNNIRITYGGREQTATDWARELGFPEYVLQRRIKSGWDAERAIETPLRVTRRGAGEKRAV